MLAVSPLIRSADDDGEVQDGEEGGGFIHDFMTDGNLLDYFDFSGPFPAFHDDGDILPDFDLDPSGILAEFSAREDLSAMSAECGGSVGKDETKLTEEEEEKDVSRSEEVVSTVTTAEDGAAVSGAADKRWSASAEGESRRKPSAPVATGKNYSPGKKKAKVDWTPELHRRFVQAVEQLGIDKAVPSRILELMGTDCLTRHNIASHLQKYRSHRKHVLAREAEAASWARGRQMYGGGGGGGRHSKRDVASPWVAPTMGFPPPGAPQAAAQHFRPLHVWGHPTVDRPLVPIWPPRHLALRPPAPPWAAQPPLPAPPDPPYWHRHYQAVMPHAMTQGTPCFPQPLPTVRFAVPPVPGMVPHPMYRPILPPASRAVSSQLPLDVHPSKESIDAAIGDVLGKPWLALPLGLKPPSTESVMVELQRQGISNVPLSCG